VNQGSYDDYRRDYYEARQPQPEPEPYPMTWNRWHLRLDVMIGMLLASLTWLLLAALAGVGFYALAADSVKDSIEEVPVEITCPDGSVVTVDADTADPFQACPS
jgi:hypothetical protein